MMNELNCTNCYIYTLDTLADWEIGFITAELNSCRYLDKNQKVNVVRIGNSLEPIKTMGGMIITPEKDITDIKFKDGDLLLLPGADTWGDAKNQAILSLVPDLLNKNVVVAAICGATIALAQHGLLNNRLHTSNALDVLKMFCPDYTGSEYYIDEPAVVDGNLITGTGLAPLEFSYEVFKKMGVMKESTLEAWYQLYKSREEKYFFELMNSLK